MNKFLSKVMLAKHKGYPSRRRSLLSTLIMSFGLLLAVAAANADVAPVSTQGNQVMFGGQPGSVSGNSLFWSNDGWGGDKFYNASVVGWLKSNWHSNIVRAAMGVEDSGGYLSDPSGNEARVKAVVDAAIANNMYVIIDWHSSHAEQYESQAISFFQDMARTYGSHNNVIYEIYNEPLSVSWSGTIKPYAEGVIGAIRTIDPDNLIVVGTPNWSQDVDVAANDPITDYHNIAYTLHFYAATHGQSLRDKAQTALNKGIPLFVTEWGTVQASGDGGVDYNSTDAWVAFMKAHNISNANWSINDKAEGASALVPGASTTGGWSDSQLTASGLEVRGIVQGWPGLGGGSTGNCNVAGVGVTIQAENYCQMSGIQTETTTDTGGGQDVGWIDNGDWMTYSVNVPAAGSYIITYRVASLNGGGVLRLENAGGNPVYGDINVPATGGWQNWVTITQVVNLPAGQQTLGIASSVGGWNLNWFRIDSNSSSSPLATLQAENYSYMSGIQTETTTDVGGGLDVGWIDAGDWLSYVNTPVTIPSTGTYTIAFRVASLNGGGKFSFEEAGGGTQYAVVTVPSTGGWQNWTTVKVHVTLSAGSHGFGIGASTGGWNLNWFSITQGAN
ncbi:MAG: cellulase family glycosylhydrolase [Steroidobacter sp.]